MSSSSSSSTTFILSSSSSASSDLPNSPALSLLPFSLGPSSAPYTSTSAPLSQYFKPRPNPNDSGSGSVIASFRGRSVVGQYVEVPLGFRGYILSTGKRPDRGGIEIHAAQDHTSEVKKTSSQNNGPSKNDIEGEEDDGTSLRRTTRQSANTRVRGAGQIALSKPKTRTNSRVNTQAKKRFRLDSDDDDDDDVEESMRSSGLTRTPSKRSKVSSYTTPQKSKSSSSSTGTDITIPEITIQEATPLKYPLPTPKKRLNQRRSSPTPSLPPNVNNDDLDGLRGKRGLPEISESMESVENIIQDRVEEVPEFPMKGEENDGESESQISNQVKIHQHENVDEASEKNSESASDLGSDVMVVKEESLIPSPSTEDDPPSFETTIKANDKPTMNSQGNTPTQVKEEEMNYNVDGPIRILKPVSKFDGFMLYTPDDALAGFRADESTQRTEEEKKNGGDVDQNGNGESIKSDQVSNSNSNTDPTIQVRKSWWRTGGSGEGGDEFIRGLGEYLGLVEILNRPVYLDGLEDDDDSDNEED